MADECLAKPLRSLALADVVHTAILQVYMRRINYDLATVHIFVSIEQRNISFQNDISLKTMKLGVLWWEKLKNREIQGRIVPRAWTSLGVEEQLPAELLIFWSCLSPGRVKKLQMIINFCLKVDHSANLNASKSTWSQLIIVVWNVQNHNLTSKALGLEIRGIRDRSSRDSRHTLLWNNWPRGNEFVRAHYVIAWNSKRRRKRHKYVTNQRNVKSLAKINIFMLGSRATKLVTAPWRIDCVLLRRRQLSAQQLTQQMVDQYLVFFQNNSKIN